MATRCFRYIDKKLTRPATIALSPGADTRKRKLMERQHYGAQRGDQESWPELWPELRSER